MQRVYINLVNALLGHGQIEIVSPPECETRQMAIPRIISEKERESLWAEVRKEFPGDHVMQEVHFVRLLHAIQLAHFSREERIEFYNRLIPKRQDR